MATTNNAIDRLTNVLADMVEQETQLVVDLLGTLRDTLQGGSSATRTLQSLVPKGLIRRTSCSCDIPPPCWMPTNAGEVTSFVCAGATATVQILVTNCSITSRTVQFRASGQGAGKVTFTPAQLKLGPLEQGTVSASIAVAAGETGSAEQNVVLWVQGCKVHYVRWKVKITTRGGTCCHEIELEDCQDYLHHWYDHFYCERPCLPESLDRNG